MPEVVMHGVKQAQTPVARIEVVADNSLLSELEIDAEVEVVIRGKVTALRAAEDYGPGMLELEVKSLSASPEDPYSGMDSDED